MAFIKPKDDDWDWIKHIPDIVRIVEAIATASLNFLLRNAMVFGSSIIVARELWRSSSSEILFITAETRSSGDEFGSLCLRIAELMSQENPVGVTPSPPEPGEQNVE